MSAVKNIGMEKPLIKEECLENLKLFAFNCDYWEKTYIDISLIGGESYSARKIFEHHRTKYEKEYERCKDIIKPE